MYYLKCMVEAVLRESRCADLPCPCSRHKTLMQTIPIASYTSDFAVVVWQTGGLTGKENNVVHSQICFERGKYEFDHKVTLQCKVTLPVPRK